MGLITSTIAGCWSVDGNHAFTSGRSSHRVRHQQVKRRTHQRRSGRILFYEKGKPYYEFTNFSPHDVVYKGKRYSTSEHLFQAFKFIDAHPHIAERIRTCSEKPMVAFDEAHTHQAFVRADWSHVHIDRMETALRLKFTQHADLKRLLLDTRSAELIEDSPRDWFWGIGADGTGRNELGKALMRLRDEFSMDGRFRTRARILRLLLSKSTPAWLCKPRLSSDPDVPREPSVSPPNSQGELWEWVGCA